MFKKHGPQKVESDDGFIIQVTGRDSVQYVSQTEAAEVYVEFSQKTYIFKDTIKYLESSKYKDLLDFQNILQRIVDGLSAMGCEVEVI